MNMVSQYRVSVNTKIKRLILAICRTCSCSVYYHVFGIGGIFCWGYLW